MSLKKRKSGGTSGMGKKKSMPKKKSSRKKQSANATQLQEQIAKSKAKDAGRELGKEVATEGGDIDQFQETYTQYSSWSNDYLPSFREMAGYEDSGVGTFNQPPNEEAEYLFEEIVDSFWEGVYEGFEDTGGRVGGLAKEHKIPVKALEHLQKEVGVDIEEITPNAYDIGGFRLQFDSQSGDRYGQDWLIFESEEKAHDAAVARVKQDLEDSPTMFNQNWLMGHFDDDAFLKWYMPDYRDNLIEQMEYQPEDYGLTSEDVRAWNEKARDAHEKAGDAYEEYLRHDEGCYEYCKSYLESKVVDFIDIEAASKDAVNTDGIGHFLAPYDFNQVDLPEGWVAYRHN